VTVTDPNAANLSCTPANGSTLAPGESLNCTASHTVTQADIDAGSYFNAACVDDGPAGAAEVCDDVTTPGSKNPALSITKVATESGYDEVGDVIHYTIVATNTGNTTLASVTVTDPNASGLTCTPANGSSLAPGASLNCTASHTIVQADLDAGHYFNQACVDDGPAGAAQACDDVDTPGAPPPKGHIMHTGVTCSNFLSNNPSDELTDATYGIKSGKVNNVAPGVMFYYISITAPSANFTINVTQSNDQGWKPIPASGSNQVILYSAPSCAKSSKGSGSYNATTGTSTITVTGASANETFVVGIKYSLSDLAGQSVTAPGPVVTYSFATNFNGVLPPLAGSQDTITVSPKP
jgi:uncharacterized repeat protein (TIGR01451 family)